MKAILFRSALKTIAFVFIPGFLVIQSISGGYDLGLDLRYTKIISNHTGKVIELFPETSTSNNDVVNGVLHQNQYLPLAYTGKSGKWVYVNFKDKI